VAVDIEAALQGLKGATSVFAERAQQGSFVDISVKRDLASLYGLNVADVHTAIEVALAGNITTTLVEGRERYGVRVRYARDYREDLARIPDLIVPTPSGGSVRLGDIASIAPVSGPAMITTENGRVLSLVFLNTRDDSDMDGLVAEAQRRIQAKVKIPAGVEYVFAGQFESWTRARERLLSILPLVLIAIALLLYANTRCWIETGIVMLAVPGSLVGAFWLLWILGYKFSIAVGVGLLALAGLDAETGVVMLLYLTQAWERRTPSTTLEQVIHQGAVQRIRPKLMTVAAALLGLLPVMWSNGAGAEVMKRMAAPMIGGIITSGLVELIAYPAIFAIWKSKK
jgi:Cu(I)/Ag(I) efflux system membrane protein CusA/SilA